MNPDYDENEDVMQLERGTVKPWRSHPPDHVCRGCCNCGCHVLGKIQACEKCRSDHYYSEEK